MRGDEVLCVGVLRRREDGALVTDLEQLAVTQHGDAVAGLGDDAEIVGIMITDRPRLCLRSISSFRICA